MRSKPHKKRLARPNLYFFILIIHFCPIRVTLYCVDIVFQAGLFTVLNDKPIERTKFLICQFNLYINDYKPSLLLVNYQAKTSDIFYKKSLEIPFLKTIVALSFFHRKIGPIMFYSYPENELDEQLSTRIANIMDQTVNEGFFTHSFENQISMNYYFKIHSDWARDNKEMLMVSSIFYRQLTPEMEQNVINSLTEFSKKLQSSEEIFTAFYINDINTMEEQEREIITKNNSPVRLWLEELYWAIIEDTRAKSEEEQIATLLSKKHIFLTLRKLSKGPISLKQLNEWFNEQFSKLSFTQIIDLLGDRKLLFNNQIGLVEKQVLLLKEVTAKRIPPEFNDSVIKYLEESTEEIDSYIIAILRPKIQEYFRRYENKTKEELEEDSFLLFQIVSDSKKYNVLSKLRIGVILKDKLPKLVSKQALESLTASLDFLKKHDVIEEIKYKKERYIALKTNIQITTAFPEYLRKLGSKESKPVVAEKYEPKQVNSIDEKNSYDPLKYLVDELNPDIIRNMGIDIPKRFQNLQELEEALAKLKAIMKQNNSLEVLVDRKYLPELFKPSLIEILVSDGLPILKPFVMKYFFNNGILSKIEGHLIEFHEMKYICIYQYNDQIGDFEELIKVSLAKLLDDDCILLFVDPKHYRVWLWYGQNTTTRMKFIAAKMAQPIRDSHGIAFKLTAVDQDNEPHAFKIMIGLEEEKVYKKEGFIPLSSQLGIPGTSYRIQLGWINDKLASRLLKGNDIIDSYIYKDEDAGEQGFPNQNMIVGWVLRTIAIPNINPHQIMKIVQVLVKQAMQKEQKNNKGNDSLTPYIGLPPSPPGDLDVASQVQLIQTEKEEENLWEKTYCKHCGSLLPEGQSICHVCGNKVI